MLTSTSLIHPSTINKIDAAMRTAIADSRDDTYFARQGLGRVYNKRGDCYLFVYHARTPTGSGFEFWWTDPDGNWIERCDDIVLNALRSYKEPEVETTLA